MSNLELKEWYHMAETRHVLDILGRTQKDILESLITFPDDRDARILKAQGIRLAIDKIEEVCKEDDEPNT